MNHRYPKYVVFAVILASVALLAGCAGLGKSKYADDPLYANGYTDGCGTGTGFNPSDPSTLLRDPDGWAKSPAYRSGWKKGFNACRPSKGGQSSNYPDDAYGRRNGPSGY